jgi:hypothetical protein
MLMQGTVGPQTNSDGTSPAQGTRQAKTGDLVVCHNMPRYYEAASRGNLFFASNTAAQAVSAALTTTYTGLCISNPIGSDYNLVMVGAQYALSVAPVAIASLHILTGYSASTDVVHTAALASPGIQSAKVGLAADTIAFADTQATTVNPTYRMSLGSGFTAGALYATTPSWIDLAGQIIVPPGGWIAWGALTAVTGFGSFSWIEVPV